MRFGRPVLGAAALAAVCLTLAYATTAATQPGPVPSDAPGYTDDPAPAALPAASWTPALAKALFETKCNECHEYQDAAQMRNDRATWALVIDRMTSNGLDATAEQKALILDYLATKYPAGG